MTENTLLLAVYTSSRTVTYIKREKKWLPKALLWKEHQFRHEKGTTTAAKQPGKKMLHNGNYFDRKDTLHGKVPEVYCIKIEG